jgi:hypothetical protein
MTQAQPVRSGQGDEGRPGAAGSAMAGLVE